METAEDKTLGANWWRLSRSTQLAPILYSLGIIYIFLGPITGTLKLWSRDGYVLFSAGSHLSLFGIVLCLAALGFNRGLKGLNLSIHGFSLGVASLLCTDWISRDYSLVKGVEMRGEIILVSLVSLVFLSIGKIRSFISVCAIALPLYLLWCFFDASGGRFIFSDDHSVVLFRLELLKQNFPFIPFYNPLWNAGLDARDFFATGTLNIFLLGSPLIYLFDVQEIYHLLIGLILFILAPFLAWLAARYERCEAPVPSIAAILTLTTSLYWYRWCLKYGSMGFITATLLVALNLILAKRILDQKEEISKSTAVLFVITSSLMLMWSLTGLIFLPLVLYAVWSLRRVIKKRYVKPIVAWLLIINIPWIILFLSVSKVSSFVSIPTTHKVEDSAQEIPKHFSQNVVKGRSKIPTPASILTHVRDYAHPLNPLLFIFAIPGIFLLKNKASKLTFGISAGWLMALGLFIAPLKPQLELERMLIVCGFVLTIPAATAMWLAISSAMNSFSKTLGALLIGILVAAIFSVGGIIYNRSIEKYTHADDVYYQLSEDIKNNVGDGRGVFVGFVLHELNNGHLAPLMLQTEKPLVASTLFHNVWRHTELVPKAYQEKGDAGIEEYLDLMNARVVIGHEKRWRDYLKAHPEKYSFISKRGPFLLYSRNVGSKSYFLEGSGEIVKQSTNSVTLRIDSNAAVIKFNFFPFLKSSGCTLGKRELPGDIKFIELTDCKPGETVVIDAKTGFRRIGL